MLKSWSSYFFPLLIYCAVGAVSLIYVGLLFSVIKSGIGHLSFDFLLTSPENAGRSGGVGPMIVSTLLILFVCFSFVIPIGLGAAMWLSQEFSQRSFARRGVRYSLDVLAGVPSIVFGLFGNILFCQILGLGFSILSGGLTLACMVLPIFINISEKCLRQVPLSYRQAGMALGLKETSILFKVVLPVALPGLGAAFILGLGRALAETAALIFTSGYVARMPSSLLDSGRSLSIHIYDLAMNVPGAGRAAYATALLLLLVVAAFNLLANAILEKGHFGGAK